MQIKQMVYKTKVKIASLYAVLFIAALSYGALLISGAFRYREEDLEYTRKEMILAKGGVRAVFNDGYMAFYSGKRKITEDSGLACFFSAGGVSYASFKAVWKIIKHTPVEFYAVCGWPGLPTRQDWHLSLGDNVVKWEVGMENSADITIENMGMVFAFKNIYREWRSLYEQGDIPVLNMWQQRQDVEFHAYSSIIGLSVPGADSGSFPEIGVSLEDGGILDEIVLSARRDMFSRGVFSAVSIGGAESFDIPKGQRAVLSSGEISLLPGEKELSDYLNTAQGN